MFGFSTQTKINEAADWSLGGKRLILSVTTGRSGSGYLCELLRAFPNVRGEHEPAPRFSHRTVEVRLNPAAAATFWLNEKLPFIRSCPESVYAETSHLACKGFLEPLFENGIVPDLITLYRDPIKVASSLTALKCIPGRTKAGDEFLLHPEDPSTQRIENWQELSDWALCFWYCREIARRTTLYTDRVKALGGRVLDTTLDHLQTREGITELAQFMDAPEQLAEGSELLRRQGVPVNEKTKQKDAGVLPAAEAMLAMAADVDRRLGL